LFRHFCSLSLYLSLNNDVLWPQWGELQSLL
jgi:hypothetical protein